MELVKQGKPYVFFGDGTLASCKPISEADLAAFIADCVDQVRAWVGAAGAPQEGRAGQGRAGRGRALTWALSRWLEVGLRMCKRACPALRRPPPPPLAQEDKVNKVLPIGGPGAALSSRDQANLLFDIAGRPPKYFPVPVALMDGIIGLFDFLAKIFPGLAVRRCALFALVV